MKDRHALPDDDAYQHEVVRMLASSIESLPEEYRAVVFLRDWEGLEWGEAAEVLGIGVEEARQRLELGHELMRKQLDAHFHGGRSRAARI